MFISRDFPAIAQSRSVTKAEEERRCHKSSANLSLSLQSLQESQSPAKTEAEKKKSSSSVIIWSETHAKWSGRGQVLSTSAQVATVEYGEASLMRRPPPTSQLRLHSVISKGKIAPTHSSDRASVSWIPDYVVSLVLFCCKCVKEKI